MEIIALSGYARCGKDTAAAVLVEDFGFTRIAFADKLREVLLALNPIVAWESGYSQEAVRANDGVWWMPVYVKDVIDVYTWDGYKETKYTDEIRRLLQRLGTEAGRQCIDDNVWVDATLNNLPDGKYVVTDCRFENEARAVKERGGEVWRITRDGVGPINDHISETGLDNWNFDQHIFNYNTLETFQAWVRATYGRENE